MAAAPISREQLHDLPDFSKMYIGDQSPTRRSPSSSTQECSNSDTDPIGLYYDQHVLASSANSSVYIALIQNPDVTKTIDEKMKQLTQMMEENKYSRALAVIRMKGYEEYPLRIVRELVLETDGKISAKVHSLLNERFLGDGSYKKADQATIFGSSDKDDELVGASLACLYVKKADSMSEKALFQTIAYKNERISHELARESNHILLYQFMPEVSGMHELHSELCEKRDLYSCLKTLSFTKQESLNIARQIAEALCVLHKHRIAHLDIKAENIFVRKVGDLREDSDYKLGDFDISREKVGRDPTLTIASRECMTPGYKAPELMQFDELSLSQTPSLDIWAFGIVLLELFYRRDSTVRAILNLIIESQQMLHVVNKDEQMEDKDKQTKITHNYMIEKLKEHVAKCFKDHEYLINKYNDKAKSSPDKKPHDVLKELTIETFKENVMILKNTLIEEKSDLSSLINEMLSIDCRNRPNMEKVFERLSLI